VNDITIGIGYDGIGSIIRILVYVKDETQAKIISEAVKTFCKTPYERACEEPTVRKITRELYLSCGITYRLQRIVMLEAAFFS